MTETTSLSLIQSVIDSQKDLIILFRGGNHILTNRAFNNFFGYSSLLDYNKNYGAIVDNFVPHPSYFHKEKIEKTIKMDMNLKIVFLAVLLVIK